MTIMVMVKMTMTLTITTTMMTIMEMIPAQGYAQSADPRRREVAVRRREVKRWNPQQRQKHNNYQRQKLPIAKELIYWDSQILAYVPKCKTNGRQVAQMQGDIVELERRRTAEHREVQKQSKTKTITRTTRVKDKVIHHKTAKYIREQFN